MDFFAFDKAYVERLRDGDLPTEHHFVAYFEHLLRIKLRARMLANDKVEDLRQETFIRVIAALRREGGVRQPERFGAFVNSICNNVLLEYYRTSARNQPMENSHLEIPDKVLDLEGMLVTKQSYERVRRILDGMPQRDRDLLRAIFLEEKDKDVVCREFGVDRDFFWCFCTAPRISSRFCMRKASSASRTASPTEEQVKRYCNLPHYLSGGTNGP